MSSLSAMSHPGPSSSSAQVATEPNHTHSPTMMMSQPPPNHTVQSDANGGPYVSVHRAHPYGVPSTGPEGYPHHIIPGYVQGPPPPGGELMYAGEASTSQETAGTSETTRGDDGSPSPPAGGSGSANSKRKQPDSAASEGSVRKRRQRASGHSGENGVEGDGEALDVDVGPNGGPKHWTEEEKTRFFTWMLTSDDHWDAFRTRMNTVFRECSNELFPGRKSYTALKSCFHRNLEVFKQIHAFQVFSANRLRQMQAENPNAEHPSVDSMLETARVAGLNVGSLNVKIIDRWYETGWFELFRKRYREDPKTGLLAPYYGPSEEPEAGPSTVPAPHNMMGLHGHPSIDPHLASHHALPHAAENGPHQHPASPEPPHAMAPMQNGVYAYPASLSQPVEYRQVGQSAPHTPSTYLRSAHAAPPRTLQPSAPSPARTPTLSASRTQSDVSLHREPAPYDHAKTAQVLSKLNSVTESLLGVCSSLKELIQQQAEESRARTELMRTEAAQRQQNAAAPSTQDKEKEISIEKVTFATEILKNGPENEDIKKAAIECLTKYLMRGL